jgi:hypothetical protein
MLSSTTCSNLIPPDYAADSVQFTYIKIDSTLEAERTLLMLRLEPGPLTKADIAKLMMFLGERYAKME